MIVSTHRFKQFRCAVCGSVYSEDSVPPNDGCGGRIDIHLDLETIKETISREILEKRRGGMQKYFEMMPLKRIESIVSLGEGQTPLIQSHRLAKEMQLTNLYLKIETMNPTGSFKDRPICVGVSRAIEDGAEQIIAASSGNAASSMAAYAASAGIDAVVLVPETAPSAKLIQLKMLGAHVFRVRMSKDGVDSTTKLLKMACARYGWTPVPSFGPFNCFQFEGTKSLGYEIAEQTDWTPPDWILFPTGSGGLMAGTMKGLVEFYELGLIERVPRPVVVQPEGCAPIVRAFIERQRPETITPWGKTNTIAGGLADPFPWDGDAALKYLRELRGVAVAVSDERIKHYMLRLGRLEGVFGEPSGVAALAGLEALLSQGVIDKTDSVIVPITGSGFKDVDAMARLAGEAPLINPDIDDLMSRLKAQR